MIGMGTMDYELIVYEPKETPETFGKWQISKVSGVIPTVKLSEYYKTLHPLREKYTPEKPPKRVSTKEFLEVLLKKMPT